MIGASGINFPTNLMIRVLGADQAQSQLNKLSGQAQATAGNFKNLAGAFTGLLVAKYVKQAVTGLITPFKDLELAQKNLQALTNANTKAMDEYHKKVREVAAASPYGITELTSSLVMLRKSTGSTEQATAALGSAAKIAMASFGKLSLEKSSDMVGEMARTFGFAGKEIDVAAAKIFSAVKRTGVSIEDFSGVMGNLGMAGLRGGQGFDDLLTMFSLTKQMMPSKSMAGTQIMRLMGEMAAGKVKKFQALEDLGINLRSGGQMRSMTDILGDMYNQYAQGGQTGLDLEAGVGQAFGERSIKPLLAMFRGLKMGLVGGDNRKRYGMDAWKFFQAEIRGDTDALEELSEKYKESLGGALEFASNAAENLKQTLGEKLAPVAAGLAKAFTAVANAISFVVKIPLISEFTSAALIFGIFKAGAWALTSAFFALRDIMKVVKFNTMQNLGVTTKATAAATANAAAVQAQAMAHHNLLSIQGGSIAPGSVPPPIPGQIKPAWLRGEYNPAHYGPGTGRMAPLRTAGNMPTPPGWLGQDQALDAWRGPQSLRARAGDIAGRAASSVVSSFKYVGSAAAKLGGALMALVGGKLGLVVIGLGVAWKGINYISGKLQDWRKENRSGQGTGLHHRALWDLDNMERIGSKALGEKSWLRKYYLAKEILVSGKLQEYAIAAKQARLQREAAEKTKEVAKAVSDAGSSFYKNLTLASDTITKTMEKLKGIEGAEIQVANTKKTYEMAMRLKELGQRTGGAQGQKYMEAAAGAEGFKSRVLAGLNRPLTPAEHMQNAAYAVLIASQVDEAKKLNQGFQDVDVGKLKSETSSPLLAAMTPEQRARVKFEMSQGSLKDAAGSTFGVGGGKFSPSPKGFHKLTSNGDQGGLLNAVALEEQTRVQRAKDRAEPSLLMSLLGSTDQQMDKLKTSIVRGVVDALFTRPLDVRVTGSTLKGEDAFFGAVAKGPT